MAKRYISDGSSLHQIKKRYFSDGSSWHQIKKSYVSDGSAWHLFYNSAVEWTYSTALSIDTTNVLNSGNSETRTAFIKVFNDREGKARAIITVSYHFLENLYLPAGSTLTANCDTGECDGGAEVFVHINGTLVLSQAFFGDSVSQVYTVPSDITTNDIIVELDGWAERATLTCPQKSSR